MKSKSEKNATMNAPPTILPKWNLITLAIGKKHPVGRLKYQLTALPETQKLTELQYSYKVP